MFRLLSFALLLFPFLGVSEEIPHVLVSIAPYKEMVKNILGEDAIVTVMVPPGASAHTFEPTPRLITNAGQADIWFVIGESFESKATHALQRANPSLQIVDLREGIDLIASKEGQCCGHHRGAPDPHFWLSPRRVRQQVTRIAETLSKRYPDRADPIQRRAEHFQEELDQLDETLKKIFSSSKKIFFVSHPAYGYLANDYGLEQVSIEFEGKDPSPQQITQLLERGKKEEITTIFLQPQHSTKGAELLAKQLRAKVIILDPYGEEYISNLLYIAQQISQS